MKRLILLAAALALVAAAMAGEPRVLFVEKGQFGEVWANVTLTSLRLDEPYLPMVVAVQNLARETVTIDRGAVRLVGPDGSRYPIADLKEVRKGYEKRRLDQRVASAAGIPVNVWYRQRRLREANFFPDVGGRGGTVIDRVALRRNDALVDLLYFRRPRGFAPGQPFVLEVHPREWELPTRIRMRIE